MKVQKLAMFCEWLIAWVCRSSVTYCYFFGIHFCCLRLNGFFGSIFVLSYVPLIVFLFNGIPAEHCYLIPLMSCLWAFKDIINEMNVICCWLVAFAKSSLLCILSPMQLTITSANSLYRTESRLNGLQSPFLWIAIRLSFFQANSTFYGGGYLVSSSYSATKLHHWSTTTESTTKRGILPISHSSNLTEIGAHPFIDVHCLKAFLFVAAQTMADLIARHHFAWCKVLVELV